MVFLVSSYDFERWKQLLAVEFDIDRGLLMVSGHMKDLEDI